MKINQITVPSLDLEKSIPFYQKFGFQFIVNASPHYVRFQSPDGDSTFSIHKVDELPKGEGIYVYFERDDLDEFVDSIVAKGIQFDEMPEDRPWLWREARIKDPDGNQLIIYKAGENRINPPWRVQENA
jgi:predicted enzyme related to lactoylglutathione lyase